MPAAHCPTEQQLSAFHLGDLPEAVQDDIAAHLDQCVACEATLRRLELATDDILSALRCGAVGLDDGSPSGNQASTSDSSSREGNTEVLSDFCPPGYELQELLGEGGMGIVYKARQRQLNRVVALKMLRRQTPAALARFRTEASAIARLHHPNIIQVFDVGEYRGRAFLTLEYAEGGSLALQNVQTPPSHRASAVLLETLAQAVHYAHLHGVIHRDLKPANVLLGRDGTPKISDFGLAKQLDSDSGHTQSGDLLGTPSYMSPEQARGQTHEIGPAVDVYALGAMLYELLAGRPPFKAATPLDTLMLVMNSEASSVSQLQPGVSRDLAVITMKCLEKDPRRRYGSAQALAADLRNFLDGRPIQARAVSQMERLRRWSARNPAIAGLLVSLFVVLLTGISGITWKWREAERRREEADDERGKVVAAKKEVTAERDEAQAHLYAVRMNLARIAWEGAYARRTQDLLTACVPQQPGDPDQRGWEWHYQDRLCRDFTRSFAGHTGIVFRAAFSPDDRHLATAGQDSTVRLWDPATGTQLSVFRGHTAAIEGLAFSPDGTQLVTGSYDGTVRIWDLATGQTLHKLNHSGQVYTVAWSPNGRRVATAGTDRTIKLWDATTGQLLHTLLNLHSVWALAFSPDGSQFASGTGGWLIQLWDTESAWLLKTLRGHAETVSSLAFSPDGRRLASASYDRTTKIWDVAAGRETLTLRGHTSWIYGVAFSPDGRLIATGSGDQTVRSWDAGSGRELRLLRGMNRVRSVAFNSAGYSLAIASADGMARISDAAIEREVRILRGHGALVTGLAFDHTGKQLASTGEDKTARLWDPYSNRQCVSLDRQACNTFGVAFHPDGSRVALAAHDKTVRLCDTENGQEIQVLRGHSKTVLSVTFRHDGRELASGSDDGTVRIWDADNGRELRVLSGHNARVRSVAFHPSGRLLASAGDDQCVRIWDHDSGVQRHVLRHTSEVRCVAFNQTGTVLASGAGQFEDLGEIKLWNVETGTELRSIREHENIVAGVAFSPDGTRLASASIDGTVKLWHVRTGQELWMLRGEGKWMTGVAFSPDGTHLGASSADHTIRIWDARPWTPELQNELEAQGLVDFLRSRPLAYADIRAYLTGAPALSPDVRKQALALAQHDDAEQDADAYSRAAWAVVIHPHLPAVQYAFALRQAESSVRLVPDHGWYPRVLGAAQYRSGRYAESISTLRAVDDQLLDDGVGFAFLAMAHHRLGDTVAANECLTRVKNWKPAADADVSGIMQRQCLRHEAETLLDQTRRHEIIGRE